MWDKCKQYLKKMGTTILVASIAIWALSYFPHHAEATEGEQMELSYIGQIGKFIEPILEPCGLQWKEGVALIAGIGAKEIVASTMSVLYHGDVLESGMSSLTAFCFLIFVLLYMPCFATCIGIKNESGKWKWALFTMALRLPHAMVEAKNPAISRSALSVNECGMLIGSGSINS